MCAGSGAVTVMSVGNLGWSHVLEVQKLNSGSGHNPYLYDTGGEGTRVATDSGYAIGVGNHKTAFTRQDTRIAASTDGRTAIADESPDVPTWSPTHATFGALPEDNPNMAIFIRKLTVYSVQPDENLPSLST